MREQDLMLPKSDYVFKLIFGNDNNKDILEDFLKSVLALPACEYGNITILNPILHPDDKNAKMGILDILVETKSGRKINVEIQVENEPQMRERVVFYASKLITGQIAEGEDYNSIKQVISIMITDYELVHENECYHNCFTLYDSDTCTQFTNILEINTLELKKLPVVTDNTELWNWLRFLRADRKEDFDMIANTNPKIEKAVDVLKRISSDKTARMVYEAREKQRMDQAIRLSSAKEKGKKEAETEIAKRCLAQGLSVDQISKLTGLSIVDISKLKGGLPCD